MAPRKEKRKKYQPSPVQVSARFFDQDYGISQVPRHYNFKKIADSEQNMIYGNDNRRQEQLYFYDQIPNRPPVKKQKFKNETNRKNKKNKGSQMSSRQYKAYKCMRNNDFKNNNKKSNLHMDIVNKNVNQITEIQFEDDEPIEKLDIIQENKIKTERPSSSTLTSVEQSSKMPSSENTEMVPTTASIVDDSSSSSSDSETEMKPVTARSMVEMIEKGNAKEDSSSSSSDSEMETKPVTAHSIVEMMQKRNTKENNSSSISSRDSEIEMQIINTEIIVDLIQRENTSSKNNINRKEEDRINKDDKNCMLCDLPGHNSFQCQMICGNCSAPYHNLKNCPNPVNANTLMQRFMEFCMEQMINFNRNSKFPQQDLINQSQT